MYVQKRQASVLPGIATLVAFALVLWVVGAHMFTNVEAAGLTIVKNTLSDSAPSSVSDHEIQFKSPTGLAAGGSITITFPNEFNISTSSVAVGDVDLEVDGVGDEALQAGAAAGATWGFAIAGQNLTITSGTDTIGANATVTIKIGTNADGGSNQVTNPSATTSYPFPITVTSSAGTDSGEARVAIIENVLVTADVDTSLTFTVSGMPAGYTINGSPTTTTAASTNITLPFGTLDPNVSKTLAQRLNVATNAINGFVVTVEQDTQLQSTASGADIDGFVDGNWDTVPASWTGPTPDVNDEDTWGHWGLTSTDYVTYARASEFSSDTWVAASTTPVVVMGHNSVADGTTADIGSTTVGYQIEISSLQEAGDDYNTTLTYIATPTF